MTQMPPNPYGNPPPGQQPPYPPPPGQYPPAQYPPAGYAQGGYAAPSRTSASAVTSLVLGILGCVPFVTGLLAFIFGIVGIRATRTPAVKGRGMAIAGLVLGLISLIGWTIYFTVAGVVVAALFSGAANPLIAQTFFQQMSQGDAAGALKLCAPGTPAAEVQATIDQMRSYGGMTSYNRQNTSIVNGRTTVSGTIQFQTGGSHDFQAVVDKKGPSDMPLVQSWELKP